MERKERVLGALMGTALGDSIGLMAEGMSRRRIEAKFPYGTGHMFLPWGNIVSDETELCLFTIQSLVLASDDPKEFQWELANYIKKWVWTLPTKVDWATLSAGSKITLGTKPPASSSNSRSSSPANRAIIIGTWFGESLPEKLDFVDASTLITHKRPEVIESCRLLALAASSDPDSFFELAQDTVESEAWRITTFKLSRNEPFYNENKGVPSTIVPTCGSALKAWISHPEDIRSGVQNGLRMGGNTTGVCSLIGGLCGSQSGYQAMPDDWLHRLIDPVVQIEGFDQLASGQIWKPTIWQRFLKTNLLAYGIASQKVQRIIPPY